MTDIPIQKIDHKKFHIKHILSRFLVTVLHSNRTYSYPSCRSYHILLPTTFHLSKMNQNPSQNQNSIPTIQPSQATKLLNALKEQLAQAQSAGADTAKAKQHYARAEQIKQVLLNYRQQQQRQRSAGAAAPGGAANGAANTPSVGGAPNQMNTSQTAPQQMQSSPVGLSVPAGNSGVSGQYGLSQYGARNMGSSGPVGGAGPASSPGVNTSQGAPRSGTTPGAPADCPTLPSPSKGTRISARDSCCLNRRYVLLSPPEDQICPLTRPTS